MDQTNLNKDCSKFKRKPTLDLNNMVYGKVPPQNIEAEKMVLGAIMIERNALSEVLNHLLPAKFYTEGHQLIYQAIINLDGKSQPIDEITVVAELIRMESLNRIGGAYYIVELTKGVVSSANILSHALIINEMHMKREIIRAGGVMIHDGYEGGSDAFELLDTAERAITGILDSNDRGKITPIESALAKTWHQISERRLQDGHMTGIPAGFEDLDRITHGWQDTDLIILAARPSVGKTAFALNLARNAALDPFKPVPVAFFSLEMSEGQLMERMIARESGTFLDLIKTGSLDDSQSDYLYKHGVEPLSRAKFFIDDTPALNIFELRAKCRRLKNKHKIGLIIIDYLQLMSGTGEQGNREQEISRISRDLKGLAKELQVPIIALSQMSRAVESRQEKIPQLSDLRESGAIEQDADMVMFLYRPEYYGITSGENGESTKGETHIKIAKHRNGSLDMVKLTAKLEIQKFVDFEGGSYNPPTGTAWRPIRTPYKDDSII